MGRWKMVIGPKLKARNFPNQKTEARIGTNILNKLNGLGRAKLEAVALPKSRERALATTHASLQQGASSRPDG